MLGAYPRSSVLWSITILEPPMDREDTRLNDIATTANCIRAGWVWLHIQTPDGTPELVTFSQESFAQEDSP